MEQFVFGRLKLAAVLRFSMLVLMSTISRGILHLTDPFWLLLLAMIFCFLTLRWGTRQLLHVEEPTPEEADGKSSCDKKPAVRWVKSDKFDGITLIHHKAASTVEWHPKGDYFTTVVPTGESRAVLLHQLSKKHSHHPFRRLPGLPVAAVFHPTQ
uniref:Uncharacterized protein n=1 Tax=Aegilops tauschii subsp. strangulata TaxID=200361 RepID=A0A453Q7U6_AEGTS